MDDQMRRGHRYYLSEDGGPEREVSLLEYVSAEARAGFRGPGHMQNPPSPACSSFSASMHDWTIKGRTEPLRGARYPASWDRHP